MANSALSTLIELAENEVENAAKNLGRMIKARDDANEQLNLLNQYRSDYELRFQSNAKQGLNVTQFTNFQAFIVKLDQAVDGQKKLIQDAEYRIEIAKKNWQECEKKRLSYKTLIDRNAASELKKENKRDQKQTDERATRALFYKK
ncbi:MULTISPECIES: flagellar export protein FliJ [Undibacterium]|jgi:flagellar FliJ protein|uniref:Flagellar FliJ protein n=2 Tax=Undibacterium TaxID=401469 RepID=A0A941DH97_9BURK|nr:MULTISPECIES: flagellar export protein FliJ [Undibacterium]MBR7748061.1 flagellar export protein FliJ [Undibacterium baiyunense]GGX19406.1 flagellar FliJ protein [Undibacterium macrobrachii]